MQCLGAPRQAESGGSRQRRRAELLGSVFGSAHRDTGHGEDGACVLACQWVCLQTPDMDRCLTKRQSKDFESKRASAEHPLRCIPISLMTCFVISAVLLRLKSVLPSRTSVPHDQLRSI